MTELAADDLRTIYPAPHGRVIEKTRPTLDVHSAKFIGLSPFCVMASSGPDGTVDASPRGGGVGFVRVTSPTELLMPDRPGNNRIETFQNLLTGSGFVQLIFFVPGIDDTLRVSGTAKLVKDAELMASMEEFGKLPRAVLRVTITEAYFHCGKALMRSKLWSQEAQVARSVMPSISEIVHDQTKIGEPVGQAEIDAAYRQQL